MKSEQTGLALPPLRFGEPVAGLFPANPFTARPFAASGPHVRRHSCFSPAVYGTRAGHPSVQHFSLHHREQGRQGLSFTVEGAAASRPSRHPISSMTSLTRHSASSIALPSRMGASTGGIAVGSLHNSVRLHSSVWEKSPPLRRGSPDSSKQRLQGLCSTTGTVLPPTQRSNRGSTAVGHRTRVLQPLLPLSKRDGGLRPILDIRRLNFSLYKGKFKMLTIKTIMSQVQEGDWLSPST